LNRGFEGPSHNVAPPLPPPGLVQLREDTFAVESESSGKTKGAATNGRVGAKNIRAQRTKPGATITQAKARRENARRQTVTTILGELEAGSGAAKAGGADAGNPAGAAGRAMAGVGTAGVGAAGVCAAGRVMAKTSAPPKKAQRPVFQANPFVVPTEKRRDKLRWHMRVRCEWRDEFLFLYGSG
jgi:hypothetical protein